MYEKRHTEVFGHQRTSHSLQIENYKGRSFDGVELEVEPIRQKTYSENRAHGPTYSEGEQFLVFLTNVKKLKKKTITSFYNGPYTLVENSNDIKFRFCHEAYNKYIKVSYDTLRRNETWKRVLVRIKSSALRAEGEQPVDDAEDDCIQIEVEQTKY